MKVTLEFNLPEEREALESAQQGSKALAALEDIRTEIFRPFHKHGFEEPAMKDLIEDEKVIKAVAILESYYYAILEAYDLKL